ncbi:hypothetical protein Pf1_01588 [Flavobacterium columnare]|nr:hypothetical protein Pf1_01588 [Flavobacterium columnare]
MYSFIKNQAKIKEFRGKYNLANVIYNEYKKELLKKTKDL